MIGCSESVETLDAANHSRHLKIHCQTDSKPITIASSQSVLKIIRRCKVLFSNSCHLITYSYQVSLSQHRHQNERNSQSMWFLSTNWYQNSWMALLGNNLISNRFSYDFTWDNAVCTINFNFNYCCRIIH